MIFLECVADDVREKENDYTSRTVAPAGLGPLLEEVLRAQRAAEWITGDYCALQDAVNLVIERCRALGSPLVWPVGDAAERLAGAAVLGGEGQIRIRGWTDDVRGERVLLVVIADVTSLALQQAAWHARDLGAAEVHACGVDSPGIECRPGEAAFDSYCAVSTMRPIRSR